MYVLIKNDVVEKYPYTFQDLKNDNPNTSFSISPSENVLNNFNVYIVKDVEIPIYDRLFEKIIEKTPTKTENGEWKKTWKIETCSENEIKINKTNIQNEYENVLRGIFNQKCKEKNYDNYITCCLRSGYVGPFQKEGIAFSQWMDSCHVYLYKMLNDVELRLRKIPSISEFTNELPVLNWDII